MQGLEISGYSRFQHLVDGLVLLVGRATLDGSGVATIASGEAPGVASITVSATGVERLTLTQTFKKLLWGSAQTVKAGALADKAHINAETVSTTKHVDFAFDHPVSEGAGDTGQVSAPSTPSTQATGTGNTLWNVNLAQAVGQVKRSAGAVDVGVIAAAADTAIHTGSYLTGFASGTSCVAAVVMANNAGTITFVTVKGTPATTGTQVAPTDAQITTGVGHANWIKVAETTINRTADTTVTQTYDNTKRDFMRQINVPATPVSAVIEFALLLDLGPE